MVFPAKLRSLATRISALSLSASKTICFTLTGWSDEPISAVWSVWRKYILFSSLYVHVPSSCNTPSPGFNVAGVLLESFVIDISLPVCKVNTTFVALWRAVPEIVRSTSLNLASSPLPTVALNVGTVGLATCVCEISIVEPSGKLITATLVLSSVVPTL